MTTVKVQSVAFTGVDAVHVEIEVQKARGLFGKVAMVGLPGSAVRESRDRVRAAIHASGFPFPRSALVINMAPADLRKEGPSFDLPLALGILSTAGVLKPEALQDYLIIGELALDGRVKPVPGALAAAILARDDGHQGIMVARENLEEASIVEGLEVIPTHHLLHAVACLGGPPCKEEDLPVQVVPPGGTGKEQPGKASMDFKDVIGQESAKTAMLTAAAGGHNILMIGPPGSGKTMLARRMPTILPPLSREESLDVSRIHSFQHHGLRALVTEPPFRAPHHTISYAGLVGGSAVPRPGEISMAHKGILFLDELPEFGRRTLEALRQPLEEGIVTIARARGSVCLPAQICLVASMNPCPCGFRGDRLNVCFCTPRQAAMYLNRISGPLLDRLDLQIEVPSITPILLQGAEPGLDSRTLSAAVAEARARQAHRTRKEGPVLNAHLVPEQIKKYCILTPGAADYLHRFLERFPLSARGYARILKVARTRADLEGSDDIRKSHMKKAVMFRMLDRLKSSNEC